MLRRTPPTHLPARQLPRERPVSGEQHYARVRAVQRRLTDAAGGTIRLPVGANVRCSGAHRLRTSRPANCRVTTPVSGEQHYARVRAVQRRLTDAAGGTIRLPVGANVRCSGAHRLRTSRPANCRVTTPVSGEQHYARVRAVQRRLTDAAGGTIRLPVGANVRCSGAHRLRTSRPANCRVTTPVSGEQRYARIRPVQRRLTGSS